MTNESVKVVCSVSFDDAFEANLIAAQLDYEPESKGLFFNGYNTTGESSEPVEFYIASTYVRPSTMDSIKELVLSLIHI